MLVNWEFDQENGDTVFLVFCIVAAFVLITVLCCCFCCCKRCCKKTSRIEIIDDALGNDTSVQMEIDEPGNESGDYSKTH